MTSGYATPEGTLKFSHGSGAAEANYKKFSGLSLSNVGIGTYLGDTDAETDKAVVNAIKQSVRSGINVIDTAINYRSQKAERSVGRAVAELIDDEEASRDQIFICTKSGYVTNDADLKLGFWEYVKREYTDTGTVKADDITSSYHCMTPDYISDQLERSLKNMKLDCIDLLYLHNAVEGQRNDVPQDRFLENLRSAMVTYEEKRREGKIRFYGMATWECFRVEEASSQYLSLEKTVRMAREIGGENHGFRFIQLPFNMYYDQALLSKNQAVEGRQSSILEAAAALGIGVFTSVPFMQGRLLQPGTMPEFAGLKPSLRALQFIRSAPGVLAPLMGQKSPDHVSENLEIMKIPPMAPDEFSGHVTKLIS